MRSPEVVFDQPFGKPVVELQRLWPEVAEGQELMLEGLVEAFVHGVVLGCPRPGEILRDGKLFTPGRKIFQKLRSVVVPDIFDFALEEHHETSEKVCAVV